MTQEPQLEEGETCYYKDDASIDPDIALSYIGDKVQSILGHFQKDFEGGVSAENLGAKYGGYGSFLPMHQRSPSIWLQPKSPQTVQYSHLPRTPNPARPEGLAPNSLTVPDTSFTQRDGSYSSPSMLKLQTSKTSENASIRQNSTLSSDKVAGSFRVKVEDPSSKSGTPSDQSSLKFRLKVGPDLVARYNAEIYNLGLTSPSSSGGNSHEESDGLLLDTNETSYESPANILQIMTSFPVPGGLLSPLSEDLLNLTRETEYPVKNEYEAAPRSFAISVKTLNDDVLRGKKTEYVDKSRNLEELDHEFLLDHNDFKQKTLGSDNLDPLCDLNCKPSSVKVGESEKDVQIKKRKGSKDRVKKSMVSGELVRDTSLERIADQSCGKYEQQESRSSSAVKVGKHRIKIHQKDVSVDHGTGNRGHVNGSRASVKAYSDNTDGEVVKGATVSSSLKIGPDATFGELNESGAAHAVNRLSFEGEKKLKGSQSGGQLVSKADSLRDGGYDAAENEHSGRKNVSRLHLGEKNVGDISLKHVENPKRILERPSGDKPKKLKLENAKAKSAYADKLKERSRNMKYFDKMTSDTHIGEPPAAAIHSKEGMFGGLQQTAAAPVVIQEDWVGCDLCQKWRLLPYGTKSEQLPDKWVCSMLDWLPGMNRCDISEDETTKALHALYLVPVPENQHNFQAHADGTMKGLGSASPHHFEQDHRNFASDQVKKQKLKENQNTICTSNPVLSNGKKHLQRLALKNGSSKELKPTLAGVNATNASNMRHPSISANVVSKLNKRKGEHVVEDNANLKKRIKKEPAQHADGKVKMIKSNGAATVDNLQTSGGNLGMAGHGLSSGLCNKVAVKDGKKKSAQKDAISGRVRNFQNCVKEHKDQMQDLPDNEPLHVKNSNGREVSTKKIKLKDGQHQVETQQNNGSSLQDGKVAIKEESKTGDHHRDKKSQVSLIDEKESKRSRGDDISKRKNAEARVQSLGSKQYPVNGGINKEQQLIKPKVKLRFSMDETNGVRKDSECEHLSTTAASSSSKVSDSCKNRVSYMEMEVKASPEESVCSSPVRMPYPNHVSSLVTENVGKADSTFNDVPAISSVKKFRGTNGSSDLDIARKGTLGLANYKGSEILDSKNKLKEETNVEDNHHAPKQEVLSNTRHPFSDEFRFKSVNKGTSVDKKDHGKLGDNRIENYSAQRDQNVNDVKSKYPRSSNVMQTDLTQNFPRSSVEQISTQMEPWSGKLRIDLRQGDKQGALRSIKRASGLLKRSSMDSRPLGAAVACDAPKALKDTAMTINFINHEADRSVAVDASLGNKSVFDVMASTALKEAEDILREAEQLRNHADLIKNSGFTSESNYEYFKAAIKFLHGSSLLEAYNGESSKNLEMSPIQMYGAAAKLCKTCAYEYEKGCEMAAAALAYKCVEVAYLRVVYCKSSTTHRIWHDLQSSLQMVPLGESPSSSASDIDNLNNLATAEKTVLSKGSGSLVGNHLIAPRNRPNFVRLLDFTKDVNSAMEAAKKSQEIFAAAHVELEKFRSKEAIVSVKRVIDFSFQDVKELVRLVWIAFNNINHQGLGGNGE